MIAIISDTHLPRGDRWLPSAWEARRRAAEAIVHAGDLSTVATLERLRALGPPVHAVHGNVDDAATRARLPAVLTLKIGARRLTVVHDAGPRAGRLARMRRRFPDADAVIFGHSHLPLHETADDGFQILNPGSPTERRRSGWAGRLSMALARLDDAGRVEFELVALD